MRLVSWPGSNAAVRCFSSSSCRLSHIGSQPIPLPPSITCDIFSNNTSNSSSLGKSAIVVRVTGPGGFQDVHLGPGITASIRPSTAADTDSHLAITCQQQDDPEARGRWGLTRAMCANAVTGLSEGFSLPLRLVGVGYRAAIEQSAPTPSAKEQPAMQPDVMPRSNSQIGRQLVLRLGFPRPIRLEIPADIECEVPVPTELSLKGPDKQRLAQFAARIREWRKPEPYNGKGIFVGEEKVVRKEVKKK